MVAGILGLYGFGGIIFYLVLTLALGGMLLLLKPSDGNWKAHFRHWSDVLTDGFTTGLFVRGHHLISRSLAVSRFAFEFPHVR